MNRCFRLLMSGVSLCILVALASCGLAEGPKTGTSPTDPVNIRTDQATYRPGDAIQIFIENHRQTSIFAYDSRASCTILDLQIQLNSAWQNSKASRCSRASLAKLVEIAAGKTYHATISAGLPGVQSPGFPNGTYRLALTYATSASGPKQNMTTAYSPPFAVSA